MAERPTPAARSVARSGSPVEAERIEVDLDEVRLHPVEVDCEAGFHERLRESSCTRMVVGEPVDVVVERVDTGCGHDPGLAHGAAEEVLLTPGTLDQLARAGEERAEGAAEALGETERDGVEARGEGCGFDVERGGRVQESRAVEVHCQPELARGRDNILDVSERPDPPPRVVVCVLDREDSRALVGDLHAPRRRAPDLFGSDASAVAG